MDRKFAVLSVAIGLCFSTQAYCANVKDIVCFDSASEYQQINANVLRSIAIRESSTCRNVKRTNSNKSVDSGCMQINSVHGKDLATYGISLDELSDQCKNIYIAAWHLKKQIKRYGDNWLAVGAYHSRTPSLRDAYAKEVREIYIKNFGS